MPGAPEAEPPAAQDPGDQAATAPPPRVLLFGLPLDGLLCFAARCMRMFSCARPCRPCALYPLTRLALLQTAQSLLCCFSFAWR